MDIAALNATMKKYPMSFSDENGDSIEDKGWAYGVAEYNISKIIKGDIWKETTI